MIAPFIHEPLKTIHDSEYAVDSELVRVSSNVGIYPPGSIVDCKPAKSPSCSPEPKPAQTRIIAGRRRKKYTKYATLNLDLHPIDSGDCFTISEELPGWHLRSVHSDFIETDWYLLLTQFEQVLVSGRARRAGGTVNNGPYSERCPISCKYRPRST